MSMRALVGSGRACLAPFAAAVVLMVSLPAMSTTAGAQTEKATDAIAPVEQFSRELDNLKKTFGDLNRQIEESAKSIERLQSGDTSRKEIERLRELVGKLLGEVADNGTVAQLGARALAHARGKLKSLQQETRFTPQQLQFLIQAWTRLEAEIAQAAGELEDARTRFGGLLRSLQTTDDYVGELIEIRQGNEALKVIKGLAREINDASKLLNNFIRSVKSIEPPGS
jgi:DNA repair exonuclease SbcCD ATPase subunit